MFLFIHLFMYLRCMTAIDLFNQITAQPKWYAGIFSAQSATNFKKRFNDRSHDFGTLQKIFNHHGYYFVGGWEKR